MKKLTKKTIAAIESLSAETTAVVKGVRSRDVAAIKESAGKAKVADLKVRARRIMGEIVKVDAKGKPVNKVDRAITDTIIANAGKIRPKIVKLVQQKGETATAQDYYAIYHDILKDSGLTPMLEPEQLNRFEELRKKLQEEASGGPDRGSKCDACGVCNACAACAVCSACTITLVEGTGLTGALAGTVGTAGSLM